MTVTYRVIENYSHEHKYNDFKKDFIDGMTKANLRKKYDIPPSVWYEWRDRIIKDHGVIRKVRGRPSKPKLKREWGEYLIKSTWNGNVSIRRWVNGSYYSYGTYPSRSIAEKVAKKLVENNWDNDLAYELLDKHGTVHSKRLLLNRIKGRGI